jgi:predicted dehydrogenase
MSSSRPLRIGVIGFGARGTLLQHAHQPDHDIHVTALADPNPASCAAFTAKFGTHCLTTPDYNQLLEQPGLDAIFILSPDHLHEEHTLACLRAGKAVYLEKPMAITVAGADRILAAASRPDARLFIGHNLRHHPVFLKMRQLIASGVIGNVKSAWCRHFVGYGGDFYFKDWHAQRQFTNSLLLQKAVHDIDVLHWLCSGYATRTTAMGSLSLYHKAHQRPRNEPGIATPSLDHWPPLANKGFNPDMDVEDLSLALFELDNGVLASYQQCHYTPDVWRNYTIIGEAGRMENFNDRPGEAVIRVWNKRTVYNPYGDQQHFIPSLAGGHGGADPRIVSEFLEFVRHGAPSTIPLQAARAAVAAACCATDSLRKQGQPVDVPTA